MLPGEKRAKSAWADHDEVIAWVARYLAELKPRDRASQRGYDAWARQQDGAPGRRSSSVMVAGSQFVKKPGGGSVSRRAVPARWDGPWSCHLAPARRVFHHRAEYRLPSVSARVGEIREKKHCHRANPLRLPSKESPS